MKLILLVDIKNLGKTNDVVDVKNGYGQFLITSNKAIVMSDKSKEILDQQNLKQQENYQEQVKQANKLKDKIENITLSFTLKIQKDQVFGSISNKAILEELFVKHQIKLEKFMLSDNTQSTYQLGLHEVKVKLHKEVVAILKISIKGQE